MNSKTRTLPDGRLLVIEGFDARLKAETVSAPFAALLPACCNEDRQSAEALCKQLLALGCVEFCCIGAEAELLHDSLDAIVEGIGAVEVVTSAAEDEAEAMSYFLGAAGGGATALLALVAAHPRLLEALRVELTPEPHHAAK